MNEKDGNTKRMLKYQTGKPIYVPQVDPTIQKMLMCNKCGEDIKTASRLHASPTVKPDCVAVIETVWTHFIGICFGILIIA